MITLNKENNFLTIFDEDADDKTLLKINDIREKFHYTEIIDWTVAIYENEYNKKESFRYDGLTEKFERTLTDVIDKNRRKIIEVQLLLFVL